MSSVAMGSVVLKMEQPADQTIGHIKRISGLVRAKNLFDLIDAVDLEANPRSSRVGSVTDSIDESVRTTPEIFPFKTKGILLGAANYETLDRGRVRISFGDTSLEGILDGGHNALAIGLHILSIALAEDPKKLKKVKTWTDFRDLWATSTEELSSLRRRLSNPSDQDLLAGELEFYVPIELLVPKDPSDPISVNEFNGSLLDICSARNNNVQLRVEAGANQSGYFDHLKQVLPPAISKNVEWKTNEGGTIKAADIVALTWIPLSLLDQLPADDTGKPVESPVPQNIYRSKGDCVARYERLMSSDEVTSENAGKTTLHNQKVISALDVAKDIPELFDYIYSQLPILYNKDGGKFGRITAVKKMNPENSRTPKLSKFTKKPVPFNIPEGFVVPIVYGLKALMETTPDGMVKWKTNPHDFLRQHLEAIVPQLMMFMAPFGYDPQKFGKEYGMYQWSLTAYENALLQSR